MRSKFIIKRIKDLDTNKETEKFKYRIGRECFFDTKYIEKGTPLVVQYNNGKLFITTPVQYSKEDDFSLELKTENRLYYFERA